MFVLCACASHCMHYIMTQLDTCPIHTPLFLGAVLESKPQLVGMHERVRSDMDSKVSQGQSSGHATGAQNGKRVASVANPNAEDAAELLRCIFQLSSTESSYLQLEELIKYATVLLNRLFCLVIIY